MKRTQSQLLQFSEGYRHAQIIRIWNTQSLHCSAKAMRLEIGVGVAIAVTSCITVNVLQRFSVIWLPKMPNEVLYGLFQWSPNILNCIHPSIKIVYITPPVFIYNDVYVAF